MNVFWISPIDYLLGSNMYNREFRIAMDFAWFAINYGFRMIADDTAAASSQILLLVCQGLITAQRWFWRMCSPAAASDWAVWVFDNWPVLGPFISRHVAGAVREHNKWLGTLPSVGTRQHIIKQSILFHCMSNLSINHARPVVAEWLVNMHAQITDKLEHLIL